ncbi:MAG: LysM peptidoglycan-binding domain-containing protein, partial [Alphaproteobacteria bacterium]|nr:LysM peptidoglycan-binding domain-containing protein [Alphaproteobacteria bacterium]
MKRPGKVVAAMGLLAALVGCGWAEWPPPGESRAPRQMPRIVAGEAGTVTVQRGDTVYGLARRHKITPRAIIEANALKPPYELHAGQVLRVPSGSEYQVRTGDTIHVVAQRHGVDPYDLARANGIRPPYILKVGERLVIPSARSPSSSPSSLASRPVETVLPASPGPVATAPISPGPVGSQPAPAEQAVPAPAAEPEPALSAAGGAGRFAWPVRGRVISGYGSKAKGLRNDGINIAAPR